MNFGFEDQGDQVIYKFETKIMVCGSEDLFIDVEQLKWRDHEESEPELTLREVSDQLIKLGYSGVFYVWTELGLSGEIYQFGNYDPPMWVKHGETKGYA